MVQHLPSSCGLSDVGDTFVYNLVGEQVQPKIGRAFHEEALKTAVRDYVDKIETVVVAKPVVEEFVSELTVTVALESVKSAARNWVLDLITPGMIEAAIIRKAKEVVKVYVQEEVVCPKNNFVLGTALVHATIRDYVVGLTEPILAERVEEETARGIISKYIVQTLEMPTLKKIEDERRRNKSPAQIMGIVRKYVDELSSRKKVREATEEEIAAAVGKFVRGLFSHRGGDFASEREDREKKLVTRCSFHRVVFTRFPRCYDEFSPDFQDVFV